MLTVFCFARFIIDVNIKVFIVVVLYWKCTVLSRHRLGCRRRFFFVYSLTFGRMLWFRRDCTRRFNWARARRRSDLTTGSARL